MATKSTKLAWNKQCDILCKKQQKMSWLTWGYDFSWLETLKTVHKPPQPPSRDIKDLGTPDETTCEVKVFSIVSTTLCDPRLYI